MVGEAEPVKHCLGLRRYAAMALATGEGRELVDRSQNFTRRRANRRLHRVNVEYDERGIVIRADRG